jgi:hypothetical protein
LELVTVDFSDDWKANQHHRSPLNLKEWISY